MGKKKSVILLVTLLVFVFFASLVISKNIYGSLERTSNSKKQDFALKFIRIVNENNKENYLVSPYSVEIALNMLKDGADGDSYKQIEEVVGNRKINDLMDKDSVSIANGIFIKDIYKNTVKKNYINRLVKNYDAEVLFDQFKTPEKINNWVSDKTKKMIPELLNEVPSDFVLALVNALAIDVEWEQAFKCNNTMAENFYKDDATTIKVAMMHDYNSNGKYFETDKAKGIILPYKGKKNKGLELVALLPNSDLNTYINELDEEELNKIDKFKADEDKDVAVSLPKFTYDYDLEKFMNVLKQMGINDVFEPSHADLSKMLTNGKGEFYVSEAIHKTHIELDEKGTKAAAATAFVISKNAVSEEPDYIEIKFDKPFAYIIRDKKSKEILFFGAVYEPNKWEGSNCNEED